MIVGLSRGRLVIPTKYLLLYMHARRIRGTTPSSMSGTTHLPVNRMCSPLFATTVVVPPQGFRSLITIRMPNRVYSPDRQEKSQQLEVVRETIEALKAPPRIGRTLSPTVRRRKVAALHVLQGLCQGVEDEEISGVGAS